jgi:hypothetical protein
MPPFINLQQHFLEIQHVFLRKHLMPDRRLPADSRG